EKVFSLAIVSICPGTSLFGVFFAKNSGQSNSLSLSLAPAHPNSISEHTPLFCQRSLKPKKPLRPSRTTFQILQTFCSEILPVGVLLPSCLLASFLTLDLLAHAHLPVAL